MAKLVLSTNGAVVDQCFLAEARVTIGRTAENRIVVDDPAVGDAHAVISAVGHDYILEPLGGQQAVTVNGSRTARRILQHGDVIELGDYHLRYVDSKAASPIDLERTMLISGLDLEAAHAASARPAQPPPIPSTRATQVRFPSGRVKWLRGARSGQTCELDRVVATFGSEPEGLAVITRRPQGYFVTYVAGAARPRVNGTAIDRDPRPLRSGDVIEVADETIEFEQRS